MTKLINIIFISFVFTSCTAPSTSQLNRELSASKANKKNFRKVAHSGEPLKRFSMGSCNKSNLPQPLWPVISDQKPEFFVWLGDNVYLDTYDHNEMKRIYAEQESNVAYQEFKKDTPIIGVWDDHDFGMDGADKSYPLKKESQKLFLDFLGEALDSPRRKQEGIFTVHSYGPHHQQVRFIMLDVRYHREKPGIRADVLGEAQWEWLENELKNNTAKVNFLVSGFSVLSDVIPKSEEWADYKWAKAKLFQLLKKYKPSGLMILTGDRHFSTHISRAIKGIRYHELMSSGMTHNKKYELEAQLFKLYYGRKSTYLRQSFANVDINWDKTPMELKFSIIDSNNKAQVEQNYQLDNDNRWSKIE